MFASTLCLAPYCQRVPPVDASSAPHKDNLIMLPHPSTHASSITRRRGQRDSQLDPLEDSQYKKPQEQIVGKSLRGNRDEIALQPTKSKGRERLRGVHITMAVGVTSVLAL